MKAGNIAVAAVLAVAVATGGSAGAAPKTEAAQKSAGTAVYPRSVSAKYASQTPGKARMHTCLDQYIANKAAGGNGGMKWIQSGGGYYSTCSKKLKAG